MYVYRFIDTKNRVLYVGKTVDMGRRMKAHFTKGHLPKECYNSVAKIDCMKFKTEVDSLIAETYFINLYKPPFNKQNKATHFGNSTLIDIKPNFKLYRQLKNTSSFRGTKKTLKFAYSVVYLIFWGFILYYLFNIFY